MQHILNTLFNFRNLRSELMKRHINNGETTWMACVRTTSIKGHQNIEAIKVHKNYKGIYVCTEAAFFNILRLFSTLYIEKGKQLTLDMAVGFNMKVSTPMG